MITTIWGALAVVCYFGGVYLSVALAMVVAVCAVGGVLVYETRLSSWGRLSLGGLAGSMLLTTPSLFTATPFDPWAFNIARLFLAMWFGERVGIPLYWMATTGFRVRSNKNDLNEERKRQFRDVL